VKRAAARKIGGTCAAPTFAGHHVNPHTRHISANSAAFMVRCVAPTAPTSSVGVLIRALAARPRLMMKRIAQLTLMGVLLLAGVPLAVAQPALQPVMRLGNFIEVGNDVWMHIIATADMRYNTVENLDFEKRIRDQVASRSPTSTGQHETENDLFYAELRFGADFRYRKNFTFQLLFENQSVFDGNLVDDRSNTSNPGGTDVFGRAASTESRHRIPLRSAPVRRVARSSRFRAHS